MWRRLLVLMWMLPWPLASAAPWTQEPRDLYTRVSIAREDVEGLQSWRGDAYAEYGWATNWTLTGKVEAVAHDEYSVFDTEGWRVTLRNKLLSHKGFNITAELGVLQGGAIGGRNGCEALGAELRAGVSWSGQIRKRESFMFSEIVRREHNGCNRDRYEFGLGRRMTENIWSISQVWLERGGVNARSDKLQSELLWEGEIVDYSIGYRNENGGYFEEQSIFFALAKRF